MRTPDLLLRQRLEQALRDAPRRSSTELARQLGVTPQTVRRLLAELPARAVLSGGRTRRIRYSLRRLLRGSGEDLPLYTIDANGKGHPLASLALVQPEGTRLNLSGTQWPVPGESRDGWWDGLPYPVHAMRPQGYLGRRLARAEHRTLDVPEDLEQWSDEDILWMLSRRGTDVPGNLILGNDAYDAWLRNKMEVPGVDETAIEQAYAKRANEAVETYGGGSSAAGEFPKFTGLRELNGSPTPHVLVKFSGAAGSAAERRWSDLLVCEHLALEHLARLPGATAARSRILMHAGRTFLEVERFDRVGAHWRLSLCGLDSIQASFIGSRSTAWPELAGRLHAMGFLDAASVRTVEHLWWFGKLIANTDMHLGNLSFHAESTFRLAPAYDMLPMAYAPLAGGEVPPRSFVPELPLPQERGTWSDACAVAVQFWNAAAIDPRISMPFRTICRANMDALKAVAENV